MDDYPVVKLAAGEIIDKEEFEVLYSAPTEIIALLSIFYGSISILAVMGNTLVIWVVATTRQMRTVTNLYIANLAFADVIIGLFSIPFQFQAALLQRWNLPWFMCGFCPFVQALSVNVSVFTLTAIAIDRHRAIINPLRARPTKFVSKFIIVVIWLVALMFAIPCAVAFRVELLNELIKENGVVYNKTRPFCLNKNLTDDQLQTYRYTLVFVQYLVPFCVISFVYIQMAVKLWGTRAPGNAQDSRDITLLRNKKKVIKMLIIVVIVFGLCWLPLQLYNILYVTIPEINDYHFINIVWFCCDWLAMSNSCYNPFIYGIYNEKFKREFNKRFGTCFCKFHTTLDSQDRTLSMHTRASSMRSTYANSSMRVRKNTFSFGGIGGVAGGQAGGIGSYRSNYPQRGQKNSGGFGIAGSTGECGNPICDAITYSKPCTSNGDRGEKGVDTAVGHFVCQWRRNDFKPLQPDVMGHEEDLRLMELQSTTPPSEEPSGCGVGSDGVSGSGGIGRGGGGACHQLLDECYSLENSSCICEQELGGCTECDSTCILSKVSRGEAPIYTATPLPIMDSAHFLSTGTHY